MQHLEGRGKPVLYIGRTVLKGKSVHFLVYTHLNQLLDFIYYTMITQ